MVAETGKETRGISEKDRVAFIAGEEPYTLGPDSLPKPGTPQGEITKYHWISQRIYPGVERDYWLYIPQQYDRKQPACLMVFQDGAGYKLSLGPLINKSKP
jgi:hypothetical protein